MHYDNSERIQQTVGSGKDAGNGLLARASSFSTGILESIQALAGTTACKGVQIARLREWATDEGCWIDNPDELGIYIDRGSENEVYMSRRGTDVYKLNDFRYSDDNLTSFFERIAAHNLYFGDCAYKLVGFANNRDGKVCAVPKQQVVTHARMASCEEIRHELELMGFTAEDGGDYYTNGRHDIFDAVPNNVLVDDKGHVFFIDTIIYRSDGNGYETYKKYSPNSRQKLGK